MFTTPTDLRYFLTGSHTSSRITPAGSNTLKDRMADIYAVRISDVFTPLKNRKEICS